ncbi:MAG: hypothetical protein QM754_08720 [Tepidisphaeraceae bacterium]
MAETGWRLVGVDTTPLPTCVTPLDRASRRVVEQVMPRGVEFLPSLFHHSRTLLNGSLSSSMTTSAPPAFTQLAMALVFGFGGFMTFVGEQQHFVRLRSASSIWIGSTVTPRIKSGSDRP